MRLFRFLAYSFAFLLGAVFAFRGTNAFPAPPPKQYQPPGRKIAFTENHPRAANTGNTIMDAGKTLFISNCAACHNKNMKDNLTGPALGYVQNSWSEYPPEDLYQWIRNSQALVEAGHPRAKALWKEWSPTVMTPFPSLSDADIEAILAYIDAVYAGTYPKLVVD